MPHRPPQTTMLYAWAVVTVLGLALGQRFGARTLATLNRLLTLLLGHICVPRSKYPDYFRLTGVPSPRPLLDFNVDQAKPRPYRPFRWEYHQHMCECVSAYAVCRGLVSLRLCSSIEENGAGLVDRTRVDVPRADCAATKVIR